MRVRQLCKVMMAGTGVMALAACGGGSGMETSFIPPAPVATPTPPPPPTTEAVAIFPGLKTTTDFAVTGLSLTRVIDPFIVGDMSSAGFSVRYDASSGLYLMAFPDAALAPFYHYTNDSPNSTWWNGATIEPGGNSPASVSVLKSTNPLLPLTYTTLANFDTGGMGGGFFGWIAFGTGTPTGGVPSTGSASYAAVIRGSTVYNTGYIQGTANLQFDFAGGALTGHLDPEFVSFSGIGEGHSLGRYDFVNTVYSAGSTNYSGRLSQTGLSGTGSFSGQFTGPNAQELMARWSAPFRSPANAAEESTMFGVLVGKRQ